MTRKKRHSIGLIVVLAGFTSLLPAGSVDAWRFWTMEDGLAESFTNAIAVSPDGRVWLKHGRVQSINVLDGYSMVSIPAPKNLGSRLLISGKDELFADEESGRYSEYRQGKWTPHQVFTSAALAVGNSRILMTHPDLLFEYRTDIRTQRALVRAGQTRLGSFGALFASARTGGVWVLGQNGVAKTTSTGTSWKEYEFQSLGLTGAAEPFEAEDGSLFVVATLQATRSKVLARFDGKRWQIVHRAKTLTRGWPGVDGTHWLQDAKGLHHLNGQRRDPLDARGVLSGSVRAVTPDNRGAFWVGTNQGVARYAPPLWRTPAGLAHLRTAVESAYEDADGALWFTTTTALLCLRGDKWTEYPYPANWQNVMQVPKLLAGPGGSLLLFISRTEYNSLIAFDPKRFSFREVHPPKDHTVQRLLPRDAHSVWVCTRINRTPQHSLQIYDGKEFKEQVRLKGEWGLGIVRAVYPAADGKLWLGGSGGFGVYSNGSYRPFRAADGYTDSACFSICRLSDGSILAGGREKVFRFEDW